MGHDRLLALRAALERERDAVRRSLAQVESAVSRVRAEPDDELHVYGLAALVDTTSTGMEKAVARALSAFEGVPEGATWHRELLESESLDVEATRVVELAQTLPSAVAAFYTDLARFEAALPSS